MALYLLHKYDWQLCNKIVFVTNEIYVILIELNNEN